MADLKPGEYVFTCSSCEGTGEMEVGDKDYGDHDVIDCDICNGSGELEYDEVEAAGLIEDGEEPIRTP